MTPPRSLGYDNAHNREILLLFLDVPTIPFTLPTLSGRKFACLCAMDASQFNISEIENLCERLKRLGCVYLSTWGPDCERVHDIMDELVLGDNPAETYAGCLMTTWHANDSLKTALEFFLSCTEPNEAYAPGGCEVGLIVTVGSNRWTPAIERFVSNRINPAPERI